MVGIHSPVKIIGVAVNAGGGGALEAIFMTVQTGRIHMRTCQRKIGVVVVEYHIGIAGRMAGQTGGVIVNIPVDRAV